MPATPKAADSSSSGAKANGFINLSEEEIAFGWRSLAQQGQLSVHRLREFMQDVCGVKLSIVQAKDLLNYIDANDDGRVGQEEFKYFMQTGRLCQTDSSTFMWKPKAKFRAEHGVNGGERPPSESGKPRTEDDEDTVGPMRSAAAKGVNRATKSDAKAIAKIEQSLEKYEQETWEKLLKEEDDFLRGLFTQFDETSKGDELNSTSFHRMLARWFPLAGWCSSGKFRAPDTLAVMNYLKERSQGPQTKEPKEAAEKTGGEETATIPYELWLDVVNGKYRPENPK